MPHTPRHSRPFWILVPLGFGTLLALAILLFGGAQRAEAADLGGVTDAVSGGESVLPPPAQPVTDVVDRALNPVLGVAAPAVDQVVDPVIDRVVDPAVDVAAPALDPVLDVLAPVVTPITDVVDPPIPGLPVTPPVLGPVVRIVDPVATPVVEPLIPVVGHVVPRIGGASLLPIGATSRSEPPDALSATAPSSTRPDTASITLDRAASPSDLPTLPPNSNEPFAPLLSSTSASGGVPFQLLLFAVAVMLAGFFGSRARRLLLLGAITPRFAAVSLSARPG